MVEDLYYRGACWQAMCAVNCMCASGSWLLERTRVAVSVRRTRRLLVEKTRTMGIGFVAWLLCWIEGRMASWSSQLRVWWLA
jgi:hypothetical protein